MSNSQLLSSLKSDFPRWPCDGIDAIIVSGDLIEGARLGSPNYAEELNAQYQEALDLLIELTDYFVNGDRARVILVPGNHDVDWNTAFAAMEQVNVPPGNLSKNLTEAQTMFRWSWDTQELYRIENPMMYSQRFNHFQELHRKFYELAKFKYEIKAERPWNIFELDQGRIIVCAFNSCLENDCFRDAGTIGHVDLADCHNELLRISAQPSLIIGVWHHDMGGPPQTSDYIDPDVALALIDKGFRLALHGHRHRANIQPYKLTVTDEHRMAILGAGSLCAGPSALPSGSNRQFNLILIDENYLGCTLYVREEISPEVFGDGRLFTLGGQSYARLKWTQTILPVLPNSGRSGGTKVSDADEIEMLIRSDPQRAVEVIDAVGLDDPYMRRLKIMALEKADDSQGLIDTIGNEPQIEDELTAVFAAGEKLNALKFLQALMDNQISTNLDSGLVYNLTMRLNAIRKISGGG